MIRTGPIIGLKCEKNCRLCHFLFKFRFQTNHQVGKIDGFLRGEKRLHINLLIAFIKKKLKQGTVRSCSSHIILRLCVNQIKSFLHVKEIIYAKKLLLSILLGFKIVNYDSRVTLLANLLSLRLLSGTLQL